MVIYAISDLHLSFYQDKPMDVFGGSWSGHEWKVKKNWIDKVQDADVVLIPGDISWAKRLEEAMPDLDFIHELPGKKVILSGNHDYWWNSTMKLNCLYDNIVFLKNGFEKVGDYCICGSRGWLCPKDSWFTEHDEKIYRRELIRMELSLKSAVSAGAKDIILMMHYPPTNDKKEPSGFIELIHQYPIRKVVYGHLHGKDSFFSSFQGMVDSVEYILVSADYLEFSPVFIAEF